MSSLFTRIIDGELPGRFVHSDDKAVAFLSIQPLTAGHTLVVPRAEVDEWTDLDPALAAHVMTVAHTVGKALKLAYGCARVGVVVAGFEIPHTHVHVFPTETMADFDFIRATPMSDEDLEANRKRIVEALRRAV
ncbi:HIT family protein [Actinoplanes couchii]|uniref:Hypothetical HIT-like (Histidine triad) protein n=1 Tax=Actinoplanes couchii TaxID=403638 RepID=A0ABQ3X6Q7_9ACTN|nr:HIT family protein [Actinoplanes couchii]MDR6322005.1 diadenosine tetraphosphate (Ap4A) HIT family hydrolase [Actinoplanes couchii]GID54169.1 hypothetical HIT-like (histidine triad) protein [Actinoplanes couchii]